MKAIALLGFLMVCPLASPLALRAQTTEVASAPTAEPASPAELDGWLAPIALYPDPLLAQVLDAATKPSDVAQAEQYLAAGGDPNQLDVQPWDPSVKAIAHYPGVLKLMAGYLPWTTALGQAYLDEEPAVVEEIQRLRAEAMELGNLESTPQENVIDEDGSIEIVPTEPDVIYVPEYDSDLVYGQPEGPACIAFGPPCPMGLWMNRDFDWQCHQVLVWNHIYPRPADWWSSRRPSHPEGGQLGHHRHPHDPSENPRTRPTHFVLWQVPQVRVVGGGDPTGHGPQPGGFHQQHIEHLASAKPSDSSLVVLPNRGVMAAAHSGSSSSAIQVFSGSRPIHPTEVPGGHHTGGTTPPAVSSHGSGHWNHQEHGSHTADALHHNGGSQSETGHHSTSDSHSTTTAHTGSGGHASSGGSSSGRH